MNTIVQWQIFSPIPFSEFHPDVVYQDSDRPPELDINKKYGHYDRENFKHISFYLKDYLAGEDSFVFVLNNNQ
jgi:chondroitin polymerizing factor/chondroitin polymerizing factor 2